MMPAAVCIALGLLPALLLFLLLEGGVYPGERTLSLLRGDRSRRLPGLIPPPRPALLPVAASGGRLIACSLSGRAPPRNRC